MKKPKIFVGSSTESLPIAAAIQENLEHFADVAVWNQGIFNLSQYAFQSLLIALKDSDYSIFVFGSDDLAIIREKEYSIVRDNVLYELGLSMGLHGQNCSFIVMPRGEGENFRVPSDLIGINVGTYDQKRLSENITAAVGAACTQIRRAIEKQESIFKITSPTVLLGYYDGARDHYKIGSSMLAKVCTKICLLQVSSSLILGPEEGSSYNESPFLDALHARLQDGAELLHVTTIQGIHEHITSRNRVYPYIQDALKELNHDTENVTIMVGKNRWSIRVVEDASGNSGGSMIKLAPAVLVKYATEPTEGLFIANVGESRTCFHMAGSKMDAFFKQCEDYYHNCRILHWLEIETLISSLGSERQSSDVK